MLIRIFFLTIILVACQSVKKVKTAQEIKMKPWVSIESVPEKFEGIVIQVSENEIVLKKEVTSEGFDYFGTVHIEGVVQKYTVQGQQYDNWINFNRRVQFRVKDLSTGTVQQSSYVDGGWNTARQGISVQMDPPELLPKDKFNAGMPADQVIRQDFYIELMDRLPNSYSEPTTLEVYAEYLGMKSNAVQIKVVIDKSR